MNVSIGANFYFRLADMGSAMVNSFWIGGHGDAAMVDSFYWGLLKSNNAGGVNPAGIVGMNEKDYCFGFDRGLSSP